MKRMTHLQSLRVIKRLKGVTPSQYPATALLPPSSSHNTETLPPRMPGHIKKGTGPDPDPSPWLQVKDDLKNRLKAKPYDPKKSCWVPNSNKVEGGYVEGLTEQEMKVHSLGK